MDFKQKFVIGLSPRQVNEEYFKQVQRSCLGCFFLASKVYVFVLIIYYFQDLESISLIKMMKLNLLISMLFHQI
jgi:hypothetical protein